MLCTGVLLLLTAVVRAQLPHTTVEGALPQRMFAYTNARNAFYCGTVNGANTSGFHGITRDKKKLLEDCMIALGDSLLDRTTARTELTPAGFTRTYRAWNTREHVTFVDSLTLLVIDIETAYRGDVGVLPMWSTAFRGAQTGMRGGALALTGAPNAFARVLLLDDGAWEAPPERIVDAAHAAAGFHAPAWYIGRPAEGRFIITIEFNDDLAVPVREEGELRERTTAKEHRIGELLRTIGFSSSVPGQTDAFNWIAASANSFLMHGAMTGIYAGLPWFDDFWGRDTFIAFPGILAATGLYEASKALLRSVAALQNDNPASADYGRIPNRVQPGETIYNTADGTPWFALAAWRYIECSGDTAFARELLPVLVRAVEGARMHRIDAQGFLTHGDADTWMDAVGPQGPWSPRGNRAVEIQALWHAQLMATAFVAESAGDRSIGSEYLKLAERLRAPFLARFVDSRSGTLVDRLLADGTADATPRPNALLALRAADGLVPDSIALRTTASVMRSCVQPWGVMSLAPSDSNFHPWHEAPEFYPKDAAYHNGTIWTWLAGPAISALCRFGAADTAWVLTRTLEHIALTQGAVGTLPECMDALPREGRTEPAWSGTFSQAWSDAEYVRTMAEDYLGLQPFMLRGAPALLLDPHLPASVTAIAMNARCGNSLMHVSYRRSGKELHATVRHLEGAEVVTIGVRDPKSDEPRHFRPLAKLVTRDSVRVEIGAAPAGPELHGALFAGIERDNVWPSIRPSSVQHLTGAQIRAENPDAPAVLTLTDPTGDDRGASGTYTYPHNPAFEPGILDLTGLTIRSDENYAYFTVTLRALTQPGWHPEYGFQLTMLAIAIDETGDASAQRREVGHNSRYTFGNGRGFDRLVLVGGGIRVEDARGEALAEYIPTDIRYAFGNTATATISFALPVSVTGTPSPAWRVTVLSGAQDDHGGAGIGEFRTVLPITAEWNGGGNNREGANIYDIMEPTR